MKISLIENTHVGLSIIKAGESIKGVIEELLDENGNEWIERILINEIFL